ncbi:hypothetical protein NMH_1735 [Neisseria meningitidis H44/76]|uniref:Uncharacterized protein n=1 Tax=Neisseria meningitidis serogroup B / serotype 15 (strain H44/76) TaxID=909420 RepID=E6MZ63_NEIMH|nr:hypothetical protein NMH_1735 [Neisseria meningitidis H44/76]
MKPFATEFSDGMDIFMPSEEELGGVLYQRGQISVWLKK